MSKCKEYTKNVYCVVREQYPDRTWLIDCEAEQSSHYKRSCSVWVGLGILSQQAQLWLQDRYVHSCNPSLSRASDADTEASGTGITPG